MNPPAAPGRLRRRLALLALTLLVIVLHLGAGRWVSLGLASAQDPAPAAIDVRFVQEMAVREPPRAAPAPRPRPPRKAPAPAVAAASAPTPEAPVVAEAASQPAEPAASAPVEPPAIAPTLVAAADPAASAVGPEAAASATEPFGWPPSTQLSYTLEGSYRGPIHGEARVDWLRDDDHYQVRLEVRVPPLFTRRMLSDGRLGDNGLTPQRYDQETEVGLGSTRRETVRLADGQVQLANGQVAPLPAGVQDVASQFVQMTWLFLTRPDRLQPGAKVEFPLALPRRVGRWTYLVQERGPLSLPFGTIDAVHLVPQRDLSKPGELSVELWVAPGLMYLPVRILIRQDADNHMDLRLKTAPRIAEPVVPGT